MVVINSISCVIINHLRKYIVPNPEMYSLVTSRCAPQFVPQGHFGAVTKTVALTNANAGTAIATTMMTARTYL